MSVGTDARISVIIVTFNNEKEIGSCLKSLCGELHGWLFQIIIVDNSSEDSTKRIINGFRDKKPSDRGQIELIESEVNQGFTTALNRGLKASDGDHLLILNPDTEVQPGCLNTLINRLDENDKTGVVAPQLLNADGSVQVSCRRFPRHRDLVFEVLGLGYLFKGSQVFNSWKMGEFDHQTRRRVDQPQGACLLFNRDLLQKVGLWDEGFPMFFSDVDWCRRVKLAGYEIWFEPEAKVVHHQGASVLRNRARMIWSSHRSFYRYFKKHRSGVFFGILNEIFGLLLVSTALVRIAVQPVMRVFRNNSRTFR